MASPHLAVAPSSSNAATSPSPSPAGSHATDTPFGPGIRSVQGLGGGEQHGSIRGNSNAVSPAAPHHSSRRPGTSPAVSQLAPSASATEVKVIDGPAGRILCVADVRGNLETLNNLAAESQAKAIIHTGDFGFYEAESFERISDRTLRHLVQYSTLIPSSLRSQLLSADVPGARSGSQTPGSQPPPPPPPTTSCKEMRSQILSHPNSPLLTQFPLLLSGAMKLNVPVYTVWGACEDVRVVEKIRTNEYVVNNLHVMDEASTAAIDVGGIRLRLFGLGGAVVLHKLFDNGEGAATIAGGQGTMWTTILQIGELIDTAQKCYDPSETRMLVTHASPGREGILMQLALALKADLTLSAGLHFRYGVSYNEFSVQNDTEQFRRKLLQSKSSFGEVWDSVRSQVEDVVDDQQRVLLNNGLAVTNRVPSATTANGAVNEEPAWKNTWNWNLPDAAFGHMVLDIQDGKMSTEMVSVGFNFGYRRNNLAASASSTPTANNGPIASPSLSTANAMPPSGPATRAVPMGPSRGQSGGGGAVGGAAGSKQQPPKSPRSHNRAQAPNHAHQSSQGAGAGPESNNGQARPASSKGGRQGEAAATKEGSLAEGARNGSAPASKVADAAPATETAKESGQAEGGLPTSASNQSLKSNKSKANRRKSGSGWSSKSETEKSGEEVAEMKGSTAMSAKSGGEGEEDKEKREGGGRGSGRGGRGGGRGGRGGRGGGSGRGPSSNVGQDKRKPSGGGEKEGSSGAPKEANVAAKVAGDG